MTGSRTASVLELRPNCERCDTDLPPGSSDARICSFECTFCAACTDAMNATCPNCGGQLLTRPTRTGDALAKFPASTKRVLKPHD